MAGALEVVAGTCSGRIGAARTPPGAGRKAAAPPCSHNEAFVCAQSANGVTVKALLLTALIAPGRWRFGRRQQRNKR